MIALDTNVIVRLLVSDDSSQAEQAKAVFDELSTENVGFIATVVWVELYWVLTRGYKYSKSDVLRELTDLLNMDDIEPENRMAVACALADARLGADFADALINFTAQSARCNQVVTFDKVADEKLKWRLLT
jgi:predicted nucleic-acid-binding protein